MQAVIDSLGLSDLAKMSKRQVSFFPLTITCNREHGPIVAAVVSNFELWHDRVFRSHDMERVNGHDWF